MQVYGDIERSEEARAVAVEISARLDRCRGMPAGHGRHQSLVSAFIRAGELAQGILDADFASAGCDEIGERRAAAEWLLLQVAQAVAASWAGGLADIPIPNVPWAALSHAGPIRTKLAEGYAFYALYPEAYIAAARNSGLDAHTTVIGIRSIGAGLAALVAATLGAPTAHSVRPLGHPFDRRLSVGPELTGRLLDCAGRFAIVDEGPGLSGSSFNCVADWLVTHGVAEERIHFFPSHGGDLGSAASDEHRQRWRQAQKHVASFEHTILEGTRPEHRLENWIAATIGPLAAPLRDMSGGAWRTHHAGLSEQPADPALEKRKYLAMVNGRPWLAKFVGLGSAGEAKIELAHKLAVAGFSPSPAGLCHGFMVTPWLQTQRGSGSPPLERVLDYLAFRASLPAANPGASLDQLFAMATYNFGELWGKPAGDAVRTALGDPARWAPVRCCTDNRMHAWEWGQSADGWQKLDGLDHHAAHDLVGCQDIAWDVAGASVELSLSKAECQALATALGARTGRTIPGQFLAANELCYLGFQIGLWTMSLARNGEAERLATTRLIACYEERARFVLQSARL
jgi:hypothetical protein